MVSQIAADSDDTHMDSVIFLSEIVAELGEGNDSQEVCATADARYDRDHNLVTVELDSLIRPSGILGTRIPASWLPKHQTVKEAVPWDEASELARDVFSSWVRQVRASIPSKAAVLRR